MAAGICEQPGRIGGLVIQINGLGGFVSDDVAAWMDKANRELFLGETVVQ